MAVYQQSSIVLLTTGRSGKTSAPPSRRRPGAKESKACPQLGDDSGSAGADLVETPARQRFVKLHGRGVSRQRKALETWLTKSDQRRAGPEQEAVRDNAARSVEKNDESVQNRAAWSSPSPSRAVPAGGDRWQRNRGVTVAVVDRPESRSDRTRKKPGRRTGLDSSSCRSAPQRLPVKAGSRQAPLRRRSPSRGRRGERPSARRCSCERCRAGQRA